MKPDRGTVLPAPSFSFQIKYCSLCAVPQIKFVKNHDSIIDYKKKKAKKNNTVKRYVGIVAPDPERRNRIFEEICRLNRQGPPYRNI